MRTVRAPWRPLLAAVLALAPSLVLVAPAGAHGHGHHHDDGRPVVRGLTPSTGSTAGGERVVVRGLRLADLRRVLVGGMRARHLRVLGPRRVAVRVPPHTAGPVHIRVVTRDGRSRHTAHDVFIYTSVPPPPTPPVTVMGVAPDAGSDVGGQTVTVTGTGFAADASVDVGGAAGTDVEVVSPTRLTFLTPAHAVGQVDVRVTSAGSTSPVTAADHYVYARVPNYVSAPRPAVAPDAPVTMAAVSCAAPTECTAVGYYGGWGPTEHPSGPLVEHLVGTRWHPVVPPLPDDATDDGNARLTMVSCPSTTFCVAVGTYDLSDPGPYGVGDIRGATWVDQWDGDGWTNVAYGSPKIDPAFAYDAEALDCSSSTRCAIVGGSDNRPDAIWLDPNGWHSDPAVLPPGVSMGDFYDVDCYADGCTAVGYVSEPQGYNENVTATLSGGQWIFDTIPPPAGFSYASSPFPAIACTDALDCVTAGGGGSSYSSPRDLFVDRLVSGVWNASAVPVAAASPDIPDVTVVAAACQPSYCLVDGKFNDDSNAGRLFVAHVDSGGTVIRQSSPTLPAGEEVGGDGYSRQVDCHLTNVCLVNLWQYVEVPGDVNQVPESLIETDRSGAMSTVTVPDPGCHAGLLVTGQSATTPDDAAAVGSCQEELSDPAHPDNALLITGIPTD